MKRQSASVLRLIVVAALALTLAEPALASIADPPASAPDLRLGPGTVDVDAGVARAVLTALKAGRAELPNVEEYAITDVQPVAGGLFVSVIGLAGVKLGGDWNLLDNGAWFGLVLLAPEGGGWTGAVEGTPEFTGLLDALPEASLSAAARRDLDPRRRIELPASAYRFPWLTGTRMYYGSLGVHANGFPSLVSGWMAVDLLSDGDTAAGHAPNQLLSSAAGTITYRCAPVSGETSTAIKIGDLMYTHLLFGSNLYVGRTVTQGEALGPLKPGTFSEVCGYASQGANWFHVHFGFPNTSPFEAGGWSLNLTDSVWRRGAESRLPQTWLTADGTPPRFYYFPRMLRR